MDESLLEFLKGDPRRLDGRLTVVARIDAPIAENQPIASMVHAGFLAVQGNYRDQRTMADFFRKEFGLSMERGIEEIIDQAREQGGLEGALDPEQVRERLQAMSDSDFMPIPAKVVAVSTLAEAAQFDGDVVYLGTYSDLQFAHMAVNAMPILYQSRYREQERRDMQLQIESMLDRISLNTLPSSTVTLENFKGDVEDHLLRHLLPDMFYAATATPESVEAEERFRAFMAPYLYPEDVECIVSLVPSVRTGQAQARRHLELLVRKASALHKEDYRQLESVRLELETL